MAIPAYYSLLQRGSSGPDVALVQTWLNGVRDACTWYSELKADGKFGISTENAVKEFQLKNKMNVDGKVGANTWNVLYTRYTAKHGLHVPYPGIALRSGSSGGTVRLVQQKLNSLGERLTADGRFGAATAAAVQRFQRRNGLTADGAVGEETWEKMFCHLQVVKRSGSCPPLPCSADILSSVVGNKLSLKEGASWQNQEAFAPCLLAKGPHPSRGLAIAQRLTGGPFSFPCPHPRPAV